MGFGRMGTGDGLYYDRHDVGGNIEAVSDGEGERCHEGTMEGGNGEGGLGKG